MKGSRLSSSAAAKVAFLIFSTDARQGISHQHIQHAHAADIGAQEDHAWGVGLYCAYDGRFAAQRMIAHGLQRGIGFVGGDDCQEFALVGDS